MQDQKRPIVVWFRQDLRLADHRALSAAVSAALAVGAPVIPLYVLDDDSPGQWLAGGASRWWLHGSLAALAASFAALGSRLILRRGGAAAAVAQVAAECHAQAVYCTRGYEPWAAATETALAAALGAGDAELRRFAGTLLYEPEAVRTLSGTPFKVFTPFWRAARALPEPKLPLPAPERLPAPANWPASDDLANWRLRPTHPDWAGGLRDAWTPGEAGARACLAAFLDTALLDYGANRDRPDRAATSRLSPHLHFGEISPLRCWHAASFSADADPLAAIGAAKFLSEIGWREFSYHLLHHWPGFPSEPFRPEFAAFPWAPVDGGATIRALHAWQRGQTGYPIVDAGMRQLWAVGWMHNRVRMVAASFLIKHLLIDWRLGEAWFWDTLVDADLASNAASWQWVAGSGADAAPYFRIFNPVKQGQTFDPDGAYVRRWVPELARLPAGLIHAPWQAAPLELAAAGVRLGDTYPQPIVEHTFARERALAAFARLKVGAAIKAGPA